MEAELKITAASFVSVSSFAEEKKFFDSSRGVTSRDARSHAACTRESDHEDRGFNDSGSFIFYIRPL